MRISVLAFFIFLLHVAQVLAQPAFDVAFRAKEDIWLFRNGKYETLHQRMDKDMKRYLDPEKIEGLWGQLEMTMGPFKSVGEIKVDDLDSMYVAHVPITFEKKKMGLRMVYSRAGLISGIWLEPTKPVYHPAEYVDASRFYELKKKIPLPDYPSEGMLTLPTRGGPFPLVIIVGGSGPTDMDLTIGPNCIYKDFAWGLAQQGVAVYRYNKRTVAFGEKMVRNGKLTADEEYLEDLQALVPFLRSNPQIDSSRIYVLGHSEGGYLVPYFAAHLQGVKGFVVMAGSYRNMEELVVDQLTYLKSKARKDKKAYDAEIAKGIYMRDHLHANSPKDSLMEGVTPAYLLHLRKANPSLWMQSLKSYPVLVLQGGRDYQVTTKEFELWKSALQNHPAVQFQLYPELNHLFLEGKGASVPEEYEHPGNVSERVMKDLAGWILH